MNSERERPIPARVSSGKAAAIELSYQWISQDGPPLVDLYISKLDRRFWGESWSLLPDEAERLAQLLEEAAATVGRREPGLVGEVVHGSPPLDQPMASWLTTSVSPAPYLGVTALRVRLAFHDEMTVETPDTASLWFTPAASRRMAQGLRRNVAMASRDEAARQEASETLVPLDHVYPGLVSGHVLRVTGIGFRTHKINVYWALTPPLSEDELSNLLPSLNSSAIDDLGNEYHPSGSGYSQDATAIEPTARGLFSIKPGPQAGANWLRLFLHTTTQSKTGNRGATFQVSLSSREGRAERA